MDEWEPIPLSRLAHAGYCLRRAALLTNEQIWAESADTAKGRAEHERVHTQRIERRGDSAKIYELTVSSHTLGVAGKCDCVEAEKDEQGCRIPIFEFPVRLYPIEYKHGTIRAEKEYEIQLCAQAMCLEEMFETHITEGAIFYISSHRRYPVLFDDELRAQVKATIQKIAEIQKTVSVPTAVYGPKCRACSIREQCMPKVGRTAKGYCENLRKEAMGEIEL